MIDTYGPERRKRPLGSTSVPATIAPPKPFPIPQPVDTPRDLLEGGSLRNIPRRMTQE